MENHFEEIMLNGGLKVASLYDANGFTTEEVIAETGDYLESSYLDFKKYFRLLMLRITQVIYLKYKFAGAKNVYFLFLYLINI